MRGAPGAGPRIGSDEVGGGHGCGAGALPATPGVARVPTEDRSRSLAIRGVFWVGIYLAVAAAPLVFALLGDTPPGRDFLTDFSVALGFVGLSMMGLQFALVAPLPVGGRALRRGRRGPVPPPGLLRRHRFHPLPSGPAGAGRRRHPAALQRLEAPWRARLAVASVLCLLAVMATSIWRCRLRLRYEVWQAAHGLLSTASVLFALAHIYLVGYYVDTAWKTALWAVMTAAFLGLLVWVRLVRPWRRRRRPWEVERVRPERGDVSTLALRPLGHRGLQFAPGQFAWLMVNRSPFGLTAVGRVGAALASHSRGHRFETCHAHQDKHSPDPPRALAVIKLTATAYAAFRWSRPSVRMLDASALSYPT
jgi:hypothetical protein